MSNAVADNNVICAANEFSVLSPPSGQTCGEYLNAYLTEAGTGYLLNSDATSDCQLCPMSTTNDFLSAVSLDYDRKWRNAGIFIAYIFINIGFTIFFYWLARVPKKASRVKDEAPNKNEGKDSINDEKISDSASA
jgi:ATP-binding cassette subfamily G (WHITE) protein 2 (PDR)